MIARPRPWNCSGASTPSPPRGRIPNGNEPLKQQSSSTTVRRERVREIWSLSHDAETPVALSRSSSVSAAARKSSPRSSLTPWQEKWRSSRSVGRRSRKKLAIRRVTIAWLLSSSTSTSKSPFSGSRRTAASCSASAAGARSCWSLASA
jgi:hypothetical protein